LIFKLQVLECDTMAHNIRPTRIPLGIIVKQTKRLLLSLVVVVVLGLFIGQLALVNQLSIKGYTLGKEIESSKALLTEYERIEAAIAHNQTQEFVQTIADREFLPGNDQRIFVRVKDVVTAQR